MYMNEQRAKNMPAAGVYDQFAHRARNYAKRSGWAWDKTEGTIDYYEPITFNERACFFDTIKERGLRGAYADFLYLMAKRCK